ncbi:ribonuclease HIII [Mycoplasma haemocanis str. Illinois]|uniref:Ribonuclease n=1 Tax=Mycoplasma haemocanis (strain Illinois) TaxID=1111676 RepID=H6N5L7_MYCHN|nr:ribonuclease HIII [Mycoplasma haemocanis]AEW44976.1 ribonuclease HIII [Mycoplasma haemocanis str. Illinois]
MSFNPDWEKESYGSDESGKGDFFGGPVIAVVYINKEIIETLKEEGFYDFIKDSKQCKDSWIEKAVPEIMKILGDFYEYRVFKPVEYNRIYAEYKNMNVLFSLWHDDLHKKITAKLGIQAFRVMDAWTDLEKHHKYLLGVGRKALKVDDFCTKGESKYLSCALASLIARYYYLRQMEEISIEFNQSSIPMGCSFPSIKRAYDRLIKAGAKDEEICKVNFSTLKKVKAIRP